MIQDDPRLAHPVAEPGPLRVLRAGTAVLDSPRPLRTSLLAYGLAAALLGSAYYYVTVPDAGQLMGMRQDGVRAAQATLETGGPPLLETAAGGTRYALPHGDDPGLYVVLPLLGWTLGEHDPLLLLKWLFIGLMAPLLAVYPLVFFTLFRSLTAAAAAPLLLLAGVDQLDGADIYWVTPWCLLLGLPIVLALYVRGRLDAPAVAGLGACALVASFASSIRSYAGLGVTAAAVLVALALRVPWRRRVAVALLLVALSLAVRPLGITALEAYRDAEVQGPIVPKPITTPWHSLVIGLGYLPNPYGIRYQDEIAYALAREKVPDVEYLGPGYGDALRRVYLDILREDPGFVARTAAHKSYDVVRSALEEYLLGVVLLPLLLLRLAWRRQLRWFLLFLVPGAAVAFLQPALVMPFDQYKAGWLALFAFLWLLGLAYVVAAAARALAAVVGGAPLPLPDRRRLRAVATSREAAATAATAALAAFLLVSPDVLAFSRTTESGFYRQSESPLVSTAFAATIAEHWRLADEGEAWSTGEGAVAERDRRALRVTTGSGRSEYGLVSPTITIPAGEHVVLVDGTVEVGGMEIGVLDVDAREWRAQARFWSGQLQRAPLALGLPFSLDRPLRARIVLANWAPEDTPSEWRLTEVKLLTR